MIVKEHELPHISRTVEARLCWLNERPGKLRSRYLLQHGVRRLPAKIDAVKSVIHPESLEERQDSETLGLNDIGDVIITTASELFYDPFEQIPSNGAFILIDETTNETIAVGVLK